MPQGWISLNREITEHWIWTKFPFSYGQAWVDLLLLANHQDEKIPYKGKIIVCKKGTVNRSILFLANRWKWDRKTVKRFLSLLESDKMVTTESTRQGTTITIVNWDFYQNVRSTRGTSKGTTKSQQDGQQSPNTVDTYNNENNVNNVNNEINIVDQVIEYLNQKTGNTYNPKVKKTREHINKRLKEGFKLEDFIKVIDKKVAEWKDDPKMAPYLRPETLFSTKFDWYLNGNTKGGKTNGDNEKPEWKGFFE